MKSDMSSAELDRLLYRVFQFGMRVCCKSAGLPSPPLRDEKTRALLRDIAAGNIKLGKQSTVNADGSQEQPVGVGPADSSGPITYPHEQELARRMLAASPEVLQ
jgi:hypothetical protein